MTNYEKIEWAFDEFLQKYPEWKRTSPIRLAKDGIAAELVGVQSLQDGLWHIQYEASMYFDHGETDVYLEATGETPEEAVENLKKALKTEESFKKLEEIVEEFVQKNPKWERNGHGAFIGLRSSDIEAYGYVERSSGQILFTALTNFGDRRGDDYLSREGSTFEEALENLKKALREQLEALG